MDAVRVTDSGDWTLERAQNLLPTAAISLSGFAGLFHGSWHFALIGACALILTSLLRRQYVSHYRFTNHQNASDLVIVASSVLNGSAAASAAFLAGQLSALAWGV